MKITDARRPKLTLYLIAKRCFIWYFGFELRGVLGISRAIPARVHEPRLMLEESRSRA
ncbi:MAG: hypothetical protein ACRD22_06120 [Terriglobia bacterium]